MTETTSIKNREIYLFGPFRVEVGERLLFKNGVPVHLSGKTFDLLLALLHPASHLRSREELIETLWPRTIVEESNLTWNVNALRRALGDNRLNPHYIETVRGHGYRFIAPVTVEREAPTDRRESSETPPKSAPNEAGGDPGSTTGRRTRRRTSLLALSAIVAIVAVVAVLVWRFALPGPAQHGTGTPAIAVLPFENLSADRSNAYFAAGIQDTILSKLAGIGELRVISRTSTERYPSHPPSLKKVAAELGVGAVLEGSVQKAGNRVLINVQLIDARSNDHLWAHTYTRSLADVFAVENDVATQVATALQAKLLPGEAARLTSAPTRDPQAYLLFLQANYYANQVTSSNSAEDPAATVARAADLYHQAITRDPRFALAWARLSFLGSYAYWYEIAHTARQITEAERSARQALALDPALPQAQLAMGYVEYYGHRNYAAALSRFERVRQSLPNDANVIGAIAYIHRRLGKWQKALSELRSATALDPRNPRWPYDTGFTLMALRDYPEAEQQFDQALALEPHNYEASAFKAMALLLAGQPTPTAQHVLAGIPSDSGPRGSIAVVRFEIAWLTRHPQAALAALAKAPDWVVAPDAVGLVPTDLLRAQAWALAGNGPRSRQAYQRARVALKDSLRSQPGNSDTWSFLGLADAGLGQDSSAVRAGLKATSLTPASEDALSGSSYLVTLAKIYARVGKPDHAVKLLYRLLATPAGGFISVPLLRRDPVWDPIRKDPAFRSLVQEAN